MGLFFPFFIWRLEFVISVISVPPRQEKVDKLIFLFFQSTDIQFNICLHDNHLDPLPHITKVAIQLDWSQLSFHNSVMVQNHELIDVVKIESSLSFQLRLKILNKRFTLIEVLEILGFFPLTKKYLYLPQKVIQMSKSEKQQVGLCNFHFLRIWVLYQM